MDLMTMIVAVVAIILVFSLVLTILAFKHEEKRMGLLSAGKSDVTRIEQELAATQAEVGKLRARVQVLEKLATDGDRRLAGEIDRLRSEERI